MSSTATAPKQTDRAEVPEMNRVFEAIADGHDYAIDRVDLERRGARNRYTYLAARVPLGAGYPTAVVKVDNDSGRHWTFDLGTGFGMGEPIFVPRLERREEDDGWLLALVYEGAEHRSHLYVLDARDVEGEPLAVAHPPHHVPFGFYGTSTPRVAAF
jgi:all-trans-8'-apo-beta-carotenal 15,15'-oxygenase